MFRNHGRSKKKELSYTRSTWAIPLKLLLHLHPVFLDPFRNVQTHGFADNNIKRKKTHPGCNWET